MNKLSLPVIARSLKRLHLTDRGNLILLLLSLSITPISFADYKSDYKLKTTIEGVKEQTYKLSRDKWYLPDSESVDFAQAMEEINSGYSVDWSDLWKKYVKMSREITDTSDETWKDLSSAAVGTTGYDTRSPSEKNDFLADVLEHAGFTHIGTNEKGEHIWYPKTMWEKLQDAAKIAFHIDITKIKDLEKHLEGRVSVSVVSYGDDAIDEHRHNSGASGHSSTRDGFVIIERIDSKRFIVRSADGVLFKVNCSTDVYERLSSPDSEHKVKSKWDTFFDVAGKFGRGALAGLAVGAEIYRPFMLNRQNKKIWNSWEKQSNFALAYGYPTPPYPVTAPIAPVNLGSIFNLMGVGHQPTYYERWMEGRYGQHSANGRQWSMQQMSQDYYQQLAYQQYMCQMQGGCGGGFPGWRGGMPGWGQNPFNQMQGNLNNIFTSLPQQIQSLQQMTGSLNEEIIYRRQAAENQLKQMEALQAQFDQLNKILPPLQGYLNRAGTVYGQMSRSAQDVFQGQGNYREEFIWNRGNNFQSNGRYGYGR